MKLPAIICLLFFSSCNISKKIINTKNLSITLTRTKCGSYEVKNNGDLIGYVVKPLYVEAKKKKIYIDQFESLTKAKYSNYYDKFYRTYWFVKNRISDTLILVEMLSPKQVHLIPNCQCEEQEVDRYNQINKNKNNSKYLRSFSYNCSKGRFKILGDPD